MSEYKALGQVDDGMINGECLVVSDTRFLRASSRDKIFCFVAGVVVTISIISAIALGLRGLRHDKSSVRLIPRFPFVPVEFQAHPEYTNLTDPVATHLWRELVHHGHVFVQDATRLGMKPGIPVAGNKGERIVVSGFHGLHCLRSIREEMTILLLNHPLETTHHSHDHPTHLDHCFDYLRQLLMCNLELTYEPARVDIDGERRAVDGWGTVHQCKDWSAINGWMLENWEQERNSPGWHPPPRKGPE